jgi:nicotinate-nucleotide--dimethylbenzimidazole phosphoribosyltransferase
MPDPAARLDEIRALLPHLPGPDLDAGTAAATRERSLAKPIGSLGRLEELAGWLATWQARHPPRLDHPRTVVFSAKHGVAGRGVSPFPAGETERRVQAIVGGGGAVNQLCAMIDADLRVYEMNLDTPTADIVDAPAMSEEACARAIAYGMMAVEPGIDVLAIGTIGIGGTTAAAALCAALFGGGAGEWAGPGGGVSDTILRRRRTAVAAALTRHLGQPHDAFELLRRLGGVEFAAIVGAVLAARMGRVPVVLDGYATVAAAAVLYAADPRALDHCLAGHLSSEPGHRRVLERLGMAPVLDLGVRLGDATGATLALSVLKAAIASHTGMATAAEAGSGAAARR